MCVIIIKNPGITIPKEKIVSACHVNNDGFGISVIKDKELLSFKGYSPKGNDPDEVYRLMTEYHDLPMYLHLRFTTKGEKSLDNCHPFPLVTEEGFTLNLMHNGTLYDFGPKDSDQRSDTRAFAEDFAQPLSEAFFARNGLEMVHDPVYQKILDKYSGNGYFVVYDNLGNYHVAGGEGHTHEGWWSSNTYSFDRAHREPTKVSGWTNDNYGSRWYGEDDDGIWGQTWKRHDGTEMVWNKKSNSYVPVSERLKTQAAKTPALPAPAPVVKAEPVPFRELFDSEDTKQQSKILGFALAEAKKKSVDFASHVPPSKRVTFLELSGMSSLEDVCLLDVEEIEDLVLELPQAATLLIMDLLHDLFVQHRPMKKEAA